MDSRFVLRRAILADSIAFYRLNQETFLKTYLNKYGIPLRQEDIDCHFRTSTNPEIFATKNADLEQATWVAEDKASGALVAFVNVGQCFISHPDVRVRKDVEVHRLYVQPNQQGYRLREQLMNMALPWLEERFPRRPNLKVIKLHEYNLFGKVGDRDYRVGECSFASDIMRRESASSLYSGVYEIIYMDQSLFPCSFDCVYEIQ